MAQVNNVSGSNKMRTEKRLANSVWHFGKALVIVSQTTQVFGNRFFRGQQILNKISVNITDPNKWSIV